MVAGLGCVKAMLDAAPARDRPALISENNGALARVCDGCAPPYFRQGGEMAGMLTAARRVSGLVYVAVARCCERR